MTGNLCLRRDARSRSIGASCHGAGQIVRHGLPVRLCRILAAFSGRRNARGALCGTFTSSESRGALERTRAPCVDKGWYGGRVWSASPDFTAAEAMFYPCFHFWYIGIL